MKLLFELEKSRPSEYVNAFTEDVALPDFGKKIELIKGEVNSPIDPAPGCRFKPRCKYACDACARAQELVEIGPDHKVACQLYRQ